MSDNISVEELLQRALGGKDAHARFKLWRDHLRCANKLLRRKSGESHDAETIERITAAHIHKMREQGYSADLVDNFRIVLLRFKKQQAARRIERPERKNATKKFFKLLPKGK